MSTLIEHTNPNINFAKRVEKIVCEVCHLEVADLFLRRRFRHLAQARQLLFSILWQPHGFRSLQWLAARYGLESHRSVSQGIQKVEQSPKLKDMQITIIELLVTKLEIELFGSRSPIYDTAK